MVYVTYIVLGVIAGVASGFFGIGGGALLVPALVYIGGLTQHEAQGTTLALMLLPIGLLAVLKYYAQGNVKITIAAVLCVGFFFGGLLGAYAAHKVPAPVLKRIFGIFLLFIAVRMMMGK